MIIDHRFQTTFYAIAIAALLMTTGCTEDKATTSSSGGTTVATSRKAQQSADPLVRYSANVSRSLEGLITPPVQPHWKQVRAPGFGIAYKGDPGDVYYVRTLKKTQFPASLDELDGVRAFYREACIKESGGIIKVDVQQVLGKTAVVYYSKQVVKGVRGYRYIARCVVPG